MAKDARQRVDEATGVGNGGPPTEPHDPHLERRESVARVLRRGRERIGEDLRSVAQALRIRYIYLEAIEDGRFEDLPGSTYAVGFVRTYADYLELDGEEVVRRFKEEVEGINRKTQLVFPTPVPEGKVPGGALILISALLVSVAYGGWYYLSNENRDVVEQIPPVPANLEQLAASEQPATTPEQGPIDRSEQVVVGHNIDAPEPALPETVASRDDATTAQAAEADRNVDPKILTAPRVDPAPLVAVEQVDIGNPPPSDLSGVSDPVSPATSHAPVTLATVINAGQSGQATAPDAPVSEIESPEAAEQATAAPETASAGSIPAAPQATQLATAEDARAPQVYGADNADARIVLRARLDSWVQVRDGTDDLLLTRVLRRGDEYRVPNRDGLTLLTGNAGGIEILVDGTSLSPIGPIGSVRRDVALDPDRLKAQNTPLR